MGIKVFGHEICPMDLVTDHKTNKLSTTKIWQHIGFTVMTEKFLRLESVSWEIFVAYGGIVAGSYVAVSMLKWKLRDANPNNEDPAVPEK